MEKLFVFNGSKSQFPGGIFTDFEIARKWIKEHSLTGVLTIYPVNIGIYDWALNEGHLKIKHETQKSGSFIEKFSCAALQHYHFEEGELES